MRKQRRKFNCLLGGALFAYTTVGNKVKQLRDFTFHPHKLTTLLKPSEIKYNLALIHIGPYSASVNSSRLSWSEGIYQRALPLKRHLFT